MSSSHRAHLGQQLQGKDSALAEVGHDADGDGEEAGGVVRQPHRALLCLCAQLQAEQTLVLISKSFLEDRLVKL